MKGSQRHAGRQQIIYLLGELLHRRTRKVFLFHNMAKDPAFLFYPGDWLGGTLGMSLQQKGCYIDLLILQFNHGHFTEAKALTILRECPHEWQELKHKFIFVNGLYYNERLDVEKHKRAAYTESRRASRLKTDEDTVRIYIVRDDVRCIYKIGSSVNPLRRYNELANQINPAIMGDEKGDRKLTLIWYSDIVERSEEGKLHKKFAGCRISGEWFELNMTQLNWIYKKFQGTYVERTSSRTENENEDINEIKNEKENADKNRKKEKIILPWDSANFLMIWKRWKDYKQEEHKFSYKSAISEQTALSELVTLSEGFEENAVKIINKSISKGWKGFFKLNDEDYEKRINKTPAEQQSDFDRSASRYFRDDD